LIALQSAVTFISPLHIHKDDVTLGSSSVDKKANTVTSRPWLELGIAQTFSDDASMNNKSLLRKLTQLSPTLTFPKKKYSAREAS